MISRSGKRRAVVTGAARGIGRAVARRLIAEDIAVLAVDIDAGELEGAATDGCATRVVDVADPVAREALAREADGYDYLVNAAGIMRLRPIMEVTVEEWRTIQTINAESVFFLCQHFGPRLAPGGAIVNLSSSSSKLASTTQVAAYAASKTAILSITRSFAYALADRPVRVNAICPGIVDTPMQDSVLKGLAAERNAAVEDISAARNKAVPLGRPASADECAGAIWFLLSDEAAYMTGQSINFTGGLVTW